MHFLRRHGFIVVVGICGAFLTSIGMVYANHLHKSAEEAIALSYVGGRTADAPGLVGTF
jgi:hypothetical protein